MKKKRQLATSGILRRQFLGTVASGAMVGITARSIPVLGDETVTIPPWKMRLSTSSIHFLHLPVEQACARIAELGFEAADIWSAHASCPHLDDVLNRLGADQLKQLLVDTKLKLCSFSVYRGGYPRYAKLLGDVGGGVAIRGSTGPCAPKELTARMRDFLETLKPEIELAEQYESYLAIENHGQALLDSLDSLRAFAEMNRSPRLGIALAPYHLQAIGAEVTQAIRIAGKQLFFFYAWQRAEGIDQLPGHGPADFSPWIAALEKVRYRGYVNPFMHGNLAPDRMAQALTKSCAYLNQCFKKLKASPP